MLAGVAARVASAACVARRERAGLADVRAAVGEAAAHRHRAVAFVPPAAMTVELDGIISGTPQAATKTKIVCTLGPKVRLRRCRPFHQKSRC